MLSCFSGSKFILYYTYIIVFDCYKLEDSILARKFKMYTLELKLKARKTSKEFKQNKMKSNFTINLKS